MLQTQTKKLVVWEPLKGSQELALDTRCNHTLFTGSRGPGKSETQLMRFKRRVGLGYGTFWRGVIFDREYKHLDDLISKSKRLYRLFNDGAEFLSSTSALKWVWPTGEELLFRQFKKAEDYENYHGQEYPFQGWNELCKYPTSEPYDLMMSCNRSSFTPEKDSPLDPTGKRVLLPAIPLEVFSTTNSLGPGHNWVKERFIDAGPFGKVIKRQFEVFSPRTQKMETVTITQVTIFGSYKENIYLDPIYIASLQSDTDVNRRKSWLEGSWDVIAGGAFDDLWERSIHIKPRFKVPASWHLDRSFDWGSTHPFSVGWWAEASGEEAKLLNGDKFCPVRGSLIQIADWYGTHKIGTNVGLRMAAGDVADGIVKREQQMFADEWIASKPWSGPADNQIRDVREADVDTIERKMADKGVHWQESDKSPGSRRNGMELFRERLANAKRGEGPAIYFMDNCLASIATIPVLPRDEDHPDDVDTEAEDHPYDMVRYRVLKGSNRAARKIKVGWPT